LNHKDGRYPKRRSTSQSPIAGHLEFLIVPEIMPTDSHLCPPIDGGVFLIPNFVYPGNWADWKREYEWFLLPGNMSHIRNAQIPQLKYSPLHTENISLNNIGIV